MPSALRPVTHTPPEEDRPDSPVEWLGLVDKHGDPIPAAAGIENLGSPERAGAQVTAFAPASPPRRATSLTRRNGNGQRNATLAAASSLRPRSRLTSPITAPRRQLTFDPTIDVAHHAGTIAVSDITQPAERTLSGDWRQNRSAVLADLDASTRTAFLSAMTVVFEAYRLHSSTGDWSACARILRILLDYPALAMRVGTPKERRVYFQQAGETARQMVHTIMATAPVISAEPDAARASDLPPPPAIMGKAHAPSEVVQQMYPVEPAPTAIIASATKTAALDEEQRVRNVRRSRTILRHRGSHALSRAGKALHSLPRAPINATTLTTLRALHPQASAPMGALPAHHAAELISVEKVLGRAVKRCDNGSAPGNSGWSGAHLAAIMSGCTKEAVQGFHLLIRDVCNGVFTGELHRRLQACCLTPLSKKNDPNGVRPIAVMQVFTKCAAHCAVLLIEDRIPSLFPTTQYGVKRSGGSETAAHLMRCLLRRCSRMSPHQAAALELDFENAFNTASRQRVWETLLRHAHATGPMLKAFYVQYSEASPLLVYDGNQFVTELSSTEGVRQGDPFAALAFALTVQPLYEAAIATIKSSNGNGVAIQDDLAAVATWREVLKVFDYVRAHSHEYGLKLRVDKCAT
jgi:hypothetical protein